MKTFDVTVRVSIPEIMDEACVRMLLESTFGGQSAAHVVRVEEMKEDELKAEPNIAELRKFVDEQNAALGWKV